MSKIGMKYFVLKPKGSSVYADAARLAMLKYAEVIEKYDAELAKELNDWVFDETPQCPSQEQIPQHVREELDDIAKNPQGSVGRSKATTS